MSEVLHGTPAADGLAMPGEFEAHEATWMLWPVRPDNWRQGARPAQEAFARVAAAIAEAEPVRMGVPAAEMERAASMLPPGVELVEMESDDAWMRDVGPTVVTGGGTRRGVDWQFNAWGGEDGGLYPSWEKDEQVARQVLDFEGLGRYEAPLVMEGGSIHVDGEGTCITTEECLLNPNRNPGLGREEIEQYLRDYLGVTKVIWLGLGVVDDETDGHVDDVAFFARPGVVGLQWCEDEADPQHARSADALERLRAARDAQGRELDIVLLPNPGPLYMTEEEAGGIEPAPGTLPRLAGERLAASYANCYLANGRVIVPELDERTDDEAFAVLEGLFPGREVVPVPGREILLGGGNVHCITQQVPA
ncbi:MAG: agmatine deiminase [Solirubrobacterales bacterium]